MKKSKTQKGITLIALIITIVVLLILAVVAISSIQNDGIISYAQNASKAYNQAQGNELNILNEYLNYIPGAGNQGEGDQGSGEETKITGPLGTATNTEDYGKKVVGFTSKGEGLSDLVWRVFYRDANNVYIVTDTRISLARFYNYDPEEKEIEGLENYENGADVSRQGQDLMPLASTLFTESNENQNIIATAYLCDIDLWDKYTDADGKAAWAMGGPTWELFVKSYNTTQTDSSKFEITIDEYGYTGKTGNNSGIYNYDLSWIASPAAGGNINLMLSYEWGPVYAPMGVRPVVCIPVANFDYTLE